MQAVKKLRTVGQGLVVLVLLMVARFAQAQTGPFESAEVFITQGPGGGRVSTPQYAFDDQNNLYVAAGFSGTVQVGPSTATNPIFGQGAMFVAKRSAAGNWEWIQTVQSAGAVGIAVDGQGNVIVAGSFTDTVRFGSTVLYNTQVVQQTGSQGAYIAKLNGAGQWQWAQMIGEYSRTVRGRTLAQAVAVDGAGNTVFTGTFLAPAVYAGTTLLYNGDSTNRGVTDVFVAKVSASGQWLWAQSMGGGGLDESTSLAIDGQGNTYLTGTSFGNAPLGPLRLLPTTNWWSSFVAKLNGAGQWQWGHGLVGGGRNTPFGVYATMRHDGRVLLAGGFNSDSLRVGTTTLLNAAGPNPPQRKADVVVAEIDSAGQWQWAVQGGGRENEYIGRPFYRDGRIYVGGSLSSASVFGSHYVPSFGPLSMLVATLDTLGTPASWQHVLVAAGGGTTLSRLLGFDNNGRLLLAGESDVATIDLPPFALPAQLVTGSFSVNQTAFVARLRTDGLVGVSEAYASSVTALEIWPNPATDVVRITGPAPGTRVELLDLLGRIVGRGGVMPPAGALALPLGLARGVYVVRVGARTRRLVIE